MKLLRQPLTHFILIGGGVFAFAAFAGTSEPPPQTIVVDDALKTDLASAFSSRHGRLPERAELDEAVERWVDDEILYREGVALGLDRHDPLIRSRVIEKMRFTLKHATSVAEPSDRALRRFYEANRAQYAAPARYDFAQVRFSGQPAQARTAADAALRAIASGQRDPLSFGGHYRAFEGRTASNIAAMFGVDFANALADTQVGSWTVIESGTGAHVVQVTSHSAAGAPAYETLRPQVASDWRLEQEHNQAMELLEEVRAGYRVAGDGA